MRVYLDICCLKRPSDDATYDRIRLESEAVLSILGAPTDQVELLHLPAQDLENAQNPLAWRRERVQQLLASWPLIDPTSGSPDGLATLENRTDELARSGFGSFDAFHVASAELAGADLLVTCDDHFLAAGRRNATRTHTRIIDPITCARELKP